MSKVVTTVTMMMMTMVIVILPPQQEQRRCSFSYRTGYLYNDAQLYYVSEIKSLYGFISQTPPSHLALAGGAFQSKRQQGLTFTRSSTR